jgi:VWFA-related protein
MRGTRLAILTLALASQAAAFGAQPAAVAAVDVPFGEHLDVNVVNVEAYVTDRDGRPVRGLQRGDFTLLEDGKPVQITNFEDVDRVAPSVPSSVQASIHVAPGSGAAPAAAQAQSQVTTPADPFHLVLFIDNTHIAPTHRNRALRQIRDFLSRRVSAGDPVMLATWDPGLHVRLPFTTDREALGRALDAQEKVSAVNGAASNRHFVLQEVQKIHEIALALLGHAPTLQGNVGGGGPGAKRNDNDKVDNPQAEINSACPPDIADPVRDYAQQSRREILGSIRGLTVLINSLSGLPSRKALLHVSDGVSVTPGEDLFQYLSELCQEERTALSYPGSRALLEAQAYSVVKDWDEVAAHASAQRVTLYTLQATGLESTNASAAELDLYDNDLQDAEIDRIERENRRGSLTALATGTGGRAILDANDLGADMSRIDDDLGHYYSLGYTPPHAGDGRNHTIQVKVQRPGVRIRHRQIYRDKPPLERALDHTLASLLYGYEDNPLDVQMEVGAATAAGKGTWSVPVRLRIPLFKLALLPTEKSFEGKVRLLVATGSPSEERSQVRQVEVPIHIPRDQALTALGQYYLYSVTLLLGPGEQQLAVAVRDETATTASFLARTLHVGAPVLTSVRRSGE